MRHTMYILFIMGMTFHIGKKHRDLRTIIKEQSLLVQFTGVYFRIVKKTLTTYHYCLVV